MQRLARAVKTSSILEGASPCYALIQRLGRRDAPSFGRSAPLCGGPDIHPLVNLGPWGPCGPAALRDPRTFESFTARPYNHSVHLTAQRPPLPRSKRPAPRAPCRVPGQHNEGLIDTNPTAPHRRVPRGAARAQWSGAPGLNTTYNTSRRGGGLHHAGDARTTAALNGLVSGG